MQDTNAVDSSTLVGPWLLRQLLGELGRAGHGPRVLLGGTCIEPDDLSDPQFRLDAGVVKQCAERAFAVLGHSPLGLRIGMRLNPVSWGRCFLGLASAPHTRAALTFGARFAPCALGLVDLHCRASEDGTVLEAQPLHTGAHFNSFIVELSFAALATVFRRISGQTWLPVRADLVSRQPPDPSLHAAALDCPVHFAQPYDRLVFPASMLPLDSADEAVHDEIRRELEPHAAERATQPSLQLQIVQAVRRRLREPPTLVELASELHLSERTLRRRLVELGLSYAAIVDQQRRVHALRHLEAGVLSLHEVASLCGYSDTRSLRRAVRRWTGHAPSDLLLTDMDEA